MNLPYAWRVTKYDPALRDAQGHFTGDDWTAFSDIGRSYNGRPFTYEDYLKCENAYAQMAIAFLAETQLSLLCVTELENHSVENGASERLRDIKLQPHLLQPGQVIGPGEVGDVIRLNLREVLWCKLVKPDHFCLHFGWDYYMYIGSESPSHDAIRQANEQGLFVEVMDSPYG